MKGMMRMVHVRVYHVFFVKEVIFLVESTQYFL